MRILLSNDDGIHARGLSELKKELEKTGDVWVVAPLQERSTTGHSLTIHKPLRIVEMGRREYAVSGSPADCIYLGVRQVLKGRRPDFVVSGINRGANLGQDVYYSGTVAAAREGCMMGIPALAVSLGIDFDKLPAERELHYSTAARIAARLIKELRGTRLPEYTFLNLNVPDVVLSKVKGVRLAGQGFRFYDNRILKRKDHRGRNYFWIGGFYKGYCHRI